MGICKVSTYFLIILCFVNVGSLSANDHEISEYGLFLSPKSCFLKNKNKNCEVVITVNWNNKQPGDYCLYNNLKSAPIACWKNESRATKEVFVTIQQDIYFELREQITRKLIFKTPLKLYKKVSSLRRKRRNPWSFY